MKIKLTYLLTVVFFLSISILSAQNNFVGNWQGNINIMQTDVTFELTILKNDNLKGSLSIPEQSAFDLHLDNLKIDSTNISFGIMPAPQTAKFSGKLFTADSISGTFIQAGVQGSFFLKRTIPLKHQATLSNNFISEEVIFFNGDVKLAGTLTLPDTTGKFPALVLLTGSGQQNRDENIFGFKIFKIIAENLTNNGYAVLRFDDRGIGGSSVGETIATTADYAEDAIAAVDFLKLDKRVNSHKIGLLGHSEGGLASVIAGAASDDIAFIICMAGPAVTGSKLVLYQMRKLLKSEGVSQKIINKKLKLENQLITALKEGENLSKYKDELYNSALEDFNLTSKEKTKKLTAKDSLLASKIVIGQLNSLSNPWTKFFFNYNPKEAIENISCPILILFGEKDMQVPSSLNQIAFEDALKNNRNFKILVFPNANHLFQVSKTGLPSEYKSLEKNFTPEFLPTIINWLDEKIK